ncbi:leucine-rich repeat domain-containing protein [Thermoflexibacter ruber]|uniref:Leucine rich repeat-containing protein n=1 Tax=Thermoflexibacter ruber TaxID=1003 RepID=A0A1I2GLM7_9BACT|nr:leucine-rich repeat domain-containing protein [Thermoflexibacter ruber]SFF18485.1 Leucine rich repeat-containing protein [Thermoflexibacter ruber]
MIKRLRNLLVFIVLAYIALYFVNAEIVTAINEQILDLLRGKTEKTGTEKQANLLTETELNEYETYTSLSEISKNPQKVFKINLSNQRLDAIPAEVFQCKNLQVLDLSNNQISQIPEQIQNLAQLQELNLSNNQLLTVPPSLDDLSFLRKLDLSNNQLGELPEVFSNLARLEEINLAGNNQIHLKKVLSDLGYSRNLKKLILKMQSPEAQKEIQNLKKLLPDIVVE